MYCYTGKPYTRIYTPMKDKKLVWKAAIKKSYWLTDFGDLRAFYEDLFTNWDDLNHWSIDFVYIDDHY